MSRRKRLLRVVLLLGLLLCTAVICKQVAVSRKAFFPSLAEEGRVTCPVSDPRNGVNTPLNRGASDRQTAQVSQDSSGKTRPRIKNKPWHRAEPIWKNGKRTTGQREAGDAKKSLNRHIEELLSGEYIPHEVLVRFLPSVPKEEIDKALNKVSKVGKRQLRSHKANAVFGELYRLYLPKNVTVAEALRVLLPEPVVKYAEPNCTVHLLFTPNDPRYDELWGMQTINAPLAWNVSQGEGVLVAVVDTGCDLDHPDLAANLWKNEGEIPDNGADDDGNGFVDDAYGWDFGDDDNDPDDKWGHGTHVAGTVAAVGNNSTLVVGLAFRAKVMAVKGFPSYGQGNEFDLAEAVHYAVDNGAKVINCSWRGRDLDVMREAMQYAYDNGCIAIAAAGNDGGSGKVYPAFYDTTICVGATNADDERAWFSNYGNWLDVVAPGLSILSLDVGGGCGSRDGTSMSAPHVSALAALILAVHSDYSFEEVRNVMRSTAVDLGDPGFDIYYGYGRIDAAAALDALGPIVTIVSVTPGDGVVGPSQPAATITWRSSDDGTYSVEVGGNGTPGSGTQIDSGTCLADNPADTVIGETDIENNTVQNVYVIVNSGSETFSGYTQVTDDHTAPTSTTLLPADGSVRGSVTTISGSASDAGGSTVTSVSVSIFDGVNYYDAGTGDFDSASPVWIPVSTGTTSWSCDASMVSWVSLTDYTIQCAATDAVGNSETPGAGVTFTFDDRAPEVAIDSIAPGSGVIGFSGYAEIEWHSNKAGTFHIELGGDGTLNSGTPVGLPDTGSCESDTPVIIRIDESEVGDNGASQIWIIVEDSDDPSKTGSTWVEIADDQTAPETAIKIPEDGYHGPINQIGGTVTDPQISRLYPDYHNQEGSVDGAGVEKVEIAIFDGECYYDGNDFASPVEVWLACADTTAWTYDTGAIEWHSGVKYTARARAVDKVGNQEMPGAEVEFTFAAPIPPKKKKSYLGKGCAINDEAATPGDTGGFLLPFLVLILLTYTLRMRSRNFRKTGLFFR